MRSSRTRILALAIVSAVLYSGTSFAQAIISEDFTGTTTNSPWYYLNGACLTASVAGGTGTSGSVAGTPPGCTADGTYYESKGDSVLVGGYYGTATGSVAFGSSTALDPVGYGALRFTNGCINSSDNSCGSGSGGGHSQSGAIISANTYPTNKGLDITFKTVTYRGDSGGANGDGADGMSFFLMNGSTDLASDPTEDIGSYGGSLGYSCSNTNSNETEPYHGMVGAYLGLGIDEYGNFLNGSSNTLGESGSTSTNGGIGDNTASGGLYKPNRIGLRGAGNIAWNWLTDNYPSDYPSSLSSSYQNTAVQYTCETGTLWDFGDNPGSPTNTGTAVMDYPAIPSAYTVISSKIANEYSSKGYSRQPYTSTATNSYGTGANPITYDLKITANGLLSLSYSYNGGAWTSVIKNQSITASNGPLPSAVRFGFAGSTGGSSNIHEILCFKAAPATQAASSTTVNQQQSSKVENGSQAYFGYYDPQNWTGALTANSLINTNGVLTISSAANWDASCVLTGVAGSSSCGTTGQVGPVAAQPWTTGSGGRVILTWNGTTGIPFEWPSLSSTEQSDLDAGDSTPTADRLQFLRGDPNEQIQNGGAFRNLDSVLADIVDSSSAWVGPPSKSVFAAYESPTTWKDKLYPAATMLENSGQTYTSYASAEATRLNVVYVGANDGMIHGFSAGSYDSTGTVYNSTTNTGQEMLAYMPQGVLETIHNSTNSSIDYANPQYGHNFYVDATPGTGDLYYNGQWRTWLVGGLGPGGSEIYALDITNPANFAEANAGSLVMGDWQGGTSSTNPGSFTCQNVASCALDLGDTYGTPTIRLLHNGDWGVIFGNGLNSSTGDAGIFILTIDPSTGAQKMYYLSTGESGQSDGIAYAHPVDLDGDHVADYVYAGDALGHVWRFDLTSNDPANWAVTPGPLFTTPSGQPIMSDVYPVFVAGPSGTQLMLFFGTGQKFPLTQTTATSYATGQQSFYGVWDWNMSAWNALNSTQFASLPAGTAGTLGQSNLQLQTVSYDASTGLPSIETPYMVCWAGTSTCSSATQTAHTSATSSNNQYGWYINFPGSNSGYGATTYEQEIYNPIVVSTAIQFNSILPAIDSPLMCTPDHDEGWSYALDVRNGNPVSGFFVNNGNTKTIALQTNASGSSSEVTTTNGSGSTDYYLIYQSTTGGAGTPTQIQPANNVTGYRETWVQLR